MKTVTGKIEINLEPFDRFVKLVVNTLMPEVPAEKFTVDFRFWELLLRAEVPDADIVWSIWLRAHDGNQEVRDRITDGEKARMTKAMQQMMNHVYGAEAVEDYVQGKIELP